MNEDTDLLERINRALGFIVAGEDEFGVDVKEELNVLFIRIDLNLNKDIKKTATKVTVFFEKLKLLLLLNACYQPVLIRTCKFYKVPNFCKWLR